MSEWTAEKLAKVCKGHEGKPWWPNTYLVDVGDSYYAAPNMAADLILGSAVRWLVDHECLCTLATLPGNRYESHCDGTDYEGDSLLAAVLAACLAVTNP